MHGKKKERNVKKDEQKILKSQAKATEYATDWNNFLDFRKNEVYSLESLEVTTKLIQFTPDNYTVWNFRKKIISNIENHFSEEERESMLKKELEWDRKLLERNHKSYSCWHHRKWITDLLKDKMEWKKELDLCTFALTMDKRNFHCWNYRRFVLKKWKYVSY